MMVREKRDIKPVLFKFGMALAMSLAGILYSRLRKRKIKRSSSSSSSRSSDLGSEVGLGGGRRDQRKDGLHSIKKTSGSCGFVSVVAETYADTCFAKTTVDDHQTGLLPGSRHNTEKDGFLLPEFNDLVKELDFGPNNVVNFSKKGVEMTKPDTGTPKVYVSAQRNDDKQEIRDLRNMVRVLQEREGSLETQLLEYYGLKEQEKAVMELQNRLKINQMEAKVFMLKIESLKNENRRLEAQVADYGKIKAELEAAKPKVRLLKKKLNYDAEQNKKQILILQQRVAELQGEEWKSAAMSPEIQMKLRRCEDLEREAEELKKSNLRMQIESSELAQRLDSTQILANAVLEDPQVDALNGESWRLRQENESLVKEIEQLRADRCSDLEELVYLRWINACLRYELRNYQPPPGKTVARDLSKTLSPTSEKKAKQLILEYANTDELSERRANSMDFDSDQWSSSQASILTDSGDCDDSSVENSSTTKNNGLSKSKFLSKLRKLVMGKDSHHQNQSSSGERSAPLEDCNSPKCSSSISTGNYKDEGVSVLFAPCRLLSPKEGDSKNVDGARYSYERRYTSARRGSADFKNGLDLCTDSPEKTELIKYAEVLKESSRDATPKVRRSSASFSSF